MHVIKFDYIRSHAASKFYWGRTKLFRTAFEFHIAPNHTNGRVRLERVPRVIQKFALLPFLLATASLAAVFVVSMMATPALAAGTYAQLVAFAVHKFGPVNGYGIQAAAPIPNSPGAISELSSYAVFGYGWLDHLPSATNPATAVLATIHPAFTDSTYAAGSQWHAHTATLVLDKAGEICVAAIASPSFRLGIANDLMGETLPSSTAGAITAAGAAASYGVVLDGSNSCSPIEVELQQPNGSFTPSAHTLEVVPISATTNNVLP